MATPHLLFLRALILLGIILFAFVVVGQAGYVELALSSDRSYLSYLILGLYVLATVHWLYLTRCLSFERDALSAAENSLRDADVEQLGDRFDDVERDAPLLGGYLTVLARHRGRSLDDMTLMLATFEDEVVNRHALGHFAADGLLKLGLLGTIVGFILMLVPVAELKDFDAATMQQVLARMSGGMAVALYTTLAGLVTHLLLKLQYYVLDTAAARFVNRVGFVTNGYLNAPVPDAS